MARQVEHDIEQKIVLTGIARSKGKAAGEALVNRQRMGWAFNHVGNEDGIVLVPGADIEGESVIGKVVIYPTVMGSTTGAISLYYKSKVSHHGPAAIICQKVHDIDISGAIAGEIPAIDGLDQDPITTIKTGDWVEIDAPEVGQKATVTITPKGAPRPARPAASRAPAAARRSSAAARAMKLTQHQQDMLDGKLGEAKKFCMEKLVDFGEAVEAKEMVDVSLCPQRLSHLREGSPESRDGEKLEQYDLGHGPLYDPIFAMKDAHVADDIGHRGRKRSVPPAVRQEGREGLPLELRASGQGQLQARR